MPRRIAVVLEFLEEAHKSKLTETASRLGFELRFFPPDNVDTDYIRTCEVIYAHDPALLENADSLRWYCCSFAGIDRFRGRIKPSVMLTNSAGAYGVSVAEHGVMLTLMLLRRMPEYSAITARRGWEGGLAVKSICGARVTVLGAGDIGCAYGERVKSFAPASLSGITRSGRSRSSAWDEVLPFGELDRILPRTDILFMALPSTQETEGILSRERISRLPDGAIIINVGRGSAIDQSALYDALAAGKLGGAALDVTTPEPLPKDDPLWDLCERNVIITPHVAGNMTLAYTRDKNVEMFCSDLENYAAGKPLRYITSPDAGY